MPWHWHAHIRMWGMVGCSLVAHRLQPCNLQVKASQRHRLSSRIPPPHPATLPDTVYCDRDCDSDTVASRSNTDFVFWTYGKRTIARCNHTRNFVLEEEALLFDMKCKPRKTCSDPHCADIYVPCTFEGKLVKSVLFLFRKKGFRPELRRAVGFTEHSRRHGHVYVPSRSYADCRGHNKCSCQSDWSLFLPSLYSNNSAVDNMLLLWF